jgi:hypothetical protein
MVADSARKHGTAADALHAYNYPVLIEGLDEGLLMFVGPDRDGRLLETGLVTASDGPVIVHATSARPKYMRCSRSGLADGRRPVEKAASGRAAGLDLGACG